MPANQTPRAEDQPELSELPVVTEAAPQAEDEPEVLPKNAWVTLGLFAAFVVAFGTCASTYLFR